MTAVHLVFDTWPEEIAKPLADQVLLVLTVPRGGLLTISVLAAAYFASNGVEALRISLNRAYRVQETRPWYSTRLASLGFVMIMGATIFAAISILLVAPLALSTMPGNGFRCSPTRSTSSSTGVSTARCSC